MRRVISSVTLCLILVCLLTLTLEVETVKSNNSFDLLLDTDKKIYLLGETVTIRLRNTSDQFIHWCGYHYPFNIYTYPEEKLVFRTLPCECCFTYPLTWPPWDVLRYNWNQSDQFTLRPVEPGEYVVRDNQGWGLSAYFKIIRTDINGDCVVDIYDAVLVSSAFGATPSDTNWNPLCDIIEPCGVIDMSDVMMICQSYGEEYTP